MAGWADCGRAAGVAGAGGRMGAVVRAVVRAFGVGAMGTSLNV